MKKLIITIGIVLLAAGLAPATQGEVAVSRTTPEREARMAWWREARFGMFVHWGLYSGLAGTWQGKKVGERGGMEWIQNRVRAHTDVYAEAAIPLAQLTGTMPKSSDVWALGIQRIVPGVGMQSWTTPAAVEPTPQGFGYLIFE